MSSEKIFTKANEIKDNLTVLQQGNGIYSYKITGKNGLHCVTIKTRTGYASCSPCNGFAVRAVCSHTIAGLMKVGEVENEEVISRVVRYLFTEQQNKGREDFG